MSARILDGTAIAEQVRGGVAAEVRQREAGGLAKPGLATVLVGDNPGSMSYVKSKRKACAEVGIESFGYRAAQYRQPGRSGRAGGAAEC